MSFHSEIHLRLSATDDVVDLTKGDFDIAIRYGAGNYPGLDVELLFRNEVFPACSPQLLATGPPLRTPDDLPAHLLIHDQAIERDPLVPTWPMWLKAAGVKHVPAANGISFNNIHLALDAAIAGHGVVLAYSAIAAADLAAGRLARLFSLALPDQLAYYIVTAPGALELPKVLGVPQLAAPGSRSSPCCGTGGKRSGGGRVGGGSRSKAVVLTASESEPDLSGLRPEAPGILPGQSPCYRSPEMGRPAAQRNEAGLRPQKPQAGWKTRVLSSMLSRGSASAGVVGSVNEVCGMKRARPSVLVSLHFSNSASSARISGA